MPQPVLTDKSYTEINKGLNSIARARRNVEMAENAGIDMHEYTETLDRLQAQLEGKKRVYFPERS